MKNGFNIGGAVAAALLAVAMIGTLTACAGKPAAQPSVVKDTSALQRIRQHCEEQVGQPRIERISEHIWASQGYELASTILIHTGDGNVIVDTSILPAAAEKVKKDLLAAAPAGPVKAIIYTHSHVDHSMGSTVWAENSTRIWATDAFTDHWFKQFGLFGRSEQMRGTRQMAYHLPPGQVPCSAVGAVLRTYTLEDMSSVGPLMPTDTFTGIKELEIGGLKIVLHSAPGETHDTLFVWVPADKTLLAADDYYWAFPNLYTIRGTSPRPTEEWIKSIDAMRRLQPDHLVPSHTGPLHGAERISEVLTNYRDAIQYVRDEVVRRANRGEDIDSIAENIKLPAGLSALPYLWEGYGQVDWSARAIYSNNLGWFDGRADKLYPVRHDEAARREIALMGGPDKVLHLAQQALRDGDARWAVHLLAKLKDSGLTGEMAGMVKGLLAEALRNVASDIYNTNGRAYLLEYAQELTAGPPASINARLPVETVATMPLDIIFTGMAPRLDPAKAAGVHESLRFVFPDSGRQYTITVRNSVAEMAEGEPLPGTPAPLATVTVDSMTYKLIALKMLDAISAVAQGRMKIEGSLPGFITFMGRFQS
jgi:alkyl sulfatase BDS1-like metallo-beta-lactamase superfamily hydrolase